MLCELRRDDARQQVRAGIAALNGFGGNRGLNDMVTLEQVSFGRCVSITLKALLMSSSCSDTSQPAR
jgi:hypothetical protein